MMATRSSKIPADIQRKVTELGYDLTTELGSGAFGTAYRCAYKDITGKEIKCAAKHLNFAVKYPYVQTFRKMTSDERRERGRRPFNKMMVALGFREETLVSKTVPANLIKKGQQIRAELVANNRANHPNVIRLLNVLQFADEEQPKNPNPTHVFMFMELADSDLHKLQNLVKGVFDEITARNYSAQISRGLAHLHSHGIAHMDIKPENVLVVRVPNLSAHGGQVLKITDFGMALLFNAAESGVSKTFFGGTPRFVDPAIVRWQRDNRVYKAQPFGRRQPEFDAFAGDMWSLGVMVCQFFVGERTVGDVWSVNKDFIVDWNFEIELCYLKAAKDLQTRNSVAYEFLKRLLVSDSSQRIRADECCGTEWLRDIVAQHREEMPSYTDHK